MNARRRLRTALGGAGLVGIGLLVGQGAVVLTTPLVARLYGPAALGDATVFLGLTAVLSPLLTLRLELLMPAAGEGEARWLERTGYRAALIISFMAAVVYGALIRPGDGVGILFFWVASFSLGAMAVSAQSLIREQRYGRIALGKATTGLATAATQLGAGLRGLLSNGLELGYAVGYLSSFVVQRAGRRARPDVVGRPPSAERHTLLASGLRLALAGVMNVMSLWLILFAVRLHFGDHEAGLYSAVFRVLITPVGLVTASLLPLVTGGVGAAVRNGRTVGGPTRRWLRLLLPVGLLVTVTLWLVPGSWLVLLFGPEFEGVGVYTRALAFFVGAQILAGPLGQLLVVLGRPRTQLAWDACRFGSLVALSVAAPWIFADAASMVVALASVLGVCYLAYLALVLQSARAHDLSLSPAGSA